MCDIFWAIVFKQYSHITTIYVKMQKTCNICRASPRKTNQCLSTLQWTHLCIEVRQDQFSWHLSLESIACVSKKRYLVMGRLFQMVSLAFLLIFYKCALKLMLLVKKKSLNCVSSVIGFRQCLGGLFMWKFGYILAMQ